MQDQLKVTLLQSHLHWENAIANREHFSNLMKGISSETDLIVLPEMFTTGFTMNAESLSEENQGTTLQWMQDHAKKQDAALVGSLIISENKKYYNRLFFVKPNGSYVSYDKRHTFTLAGEDRTYASGEKQVFVDYKGWKIYPLICYDLRFPVWARNNEEYDVLLYVANWPERRISAWDALLKARAIENMAYCIGVNRIGLDGNGHAYVGHSAVYDVLGELISLSDFEKEFVETIVLKKEHISHHRNHLQFLNDRDQFSLE